MSISKFGLIGLGVMGRNLALNIADKNIALSVYNRSVGSEAQIVENFISDNNNYSNIRGFTELNSFVESIEKPRQIFVLIKSGNAIDQLLNQLVPLLAEGDIIIDGGNSHYKDTERRIELLAQKDIHFVGCGVSGGAKGARFGPSLMPGGNKQAFEIVSTVLNSIAAKDDNNKACCSYISKGGSGHYIKMIHNGMEYAEMQLLAELYALLSKSMDNNAMADVFTEWNEGPLKSFLLEITIDILRKKEGDRYILDLILDKSGSKGTGFWSVQSALELGFPASMIGSALNARYVSSFKEERKELSKPIKQPEALGKLDLSKIKNAYAFARIINHHQGFEILNLASKANKWDLDLSEIARIWTNGCIIRSELMEDLSLDLKHANGLFSLYKYLNFLGQNESDLEQLIHLGVSQRISLDCFSAAYTYWVSMTSERLPANLIQAQRDYFGGHGFKRIDKPEDQDFNHNWDH